MKIFKILKKVIQTITFIIPLVKGLKDIWKKENSPGPQ